MTWRPLKILLDSLYSRVEYSDIFAYQEKCATPQRKTYANTVLHIPETRQELESLVKSDTCIFNLNRIFIDKTNADVYACLVNNQNKWKPDNRENCMRLYHEDEKTPFQADHFMFNEVKKYEKRCKAQEMQVVYPDTIEEIYLRNNNDTCLFGYESYRIDPATMSVRLYISLNEYEYGQDGFIFKQQMYVEIRETHRERESDSPQKDTSLSGYKTTSVSKVKTN